MTAPRGEGPRRKGVRVGSRRRGGTVHAAVRGGRVLVTVAHMTGLQVEVSREDARDFALGLLELLEDSPA